MMKKKKKKKQMRKSKEVEMEKTRKGWSLAVHFMFLVYV